MTLLNLMVIYTADLERTRQFYAALGLGFEREQHGRGPIHYAARLGEVVLELYPATEASGVSDALRLGFAIAKLDPMVERLEAAGARLVSPPEVIAWGYRAVLCDWEGRRVELLERRDREGRCC